ncbi:heat shock protein HSP60 family protein [Ceratobasidium sp. AG-Ba]|nr:heat shock protein HSP60 family protein [Ceratobasidium sp. AG-Ba]QRV99421.1 heat shock protein HSP60 family protein [Ceratobasidium sp. AG-Ba]
MNQAQDYEFNLWDDEDAGVSQSYPFVYGPDGQGEIHPAQDSQPGDANSEVEAQLGPSNADDSNGQPTDMAEFPGPSASAAFQDPTQPGVVSYAIPTVNTPLSEPVVSTSASNLATSTETIPSSPVSSTISTSRSLIPTTSALVAHTQTTTPISSHTTPHASLLSIASTTTQETRTESSGPITSIVIATPNLPRPTPSTAVQAFRHTPGFIVLIIFCILTFLGTLFASLSWLVRRHGRRKEDENWIGSLVYDEPTDHGGTSTIVERNNVSRQDLNELEKGKEPHWLAAPEDSGRAGVSMAPTRGWSLDVGTIEPGRTHATTAHPFVNTPMSGYSFATPAPAAFTPASSYHGFTPNPDYRRASVLQRGPPAVSDYDSYGIDGAGLTFRRDLAGTYLAPVTEQGQEHDHSDIVTPNPFQSDVNPDPHTRRPEAATVHDAASHLSYTYDRAGPFAITNLLPGDISSGSASLSSLVGARPRSLGLPSGRLDDPNPWKRYEGVENRGGVAGSGAEVDAADEGGRVVSVRSAVGRKVGGSDTTLKHEEEVDRFTPIPGLVPRRTRKTSRSVNQSLGAGRQARILQRLGSTSTTSTQVTTCSSDDGQFFSTRATSRRDTTSTWATTRSRSQGARGKKHDDKDENGGAGGAVMMKTRTMSGASSEWGSGELIRVLGLSGKKRTD